MDKNIADFFIRFFDIIFSLLALILLFQILIIVMIILKFTGEGEIFYLQERMGSDNTPFFILKFATMLKDSANIGNKTVTMVGDPRILPFGKFLRKTKINELPQLINILKGDMSVIGPRPRTVKFYNALAGEFKNYVSQVRPGLSGIGSIIFRNEEEILSKVDNPVEFDLDIITPYKGEIEKWYVENRSIKMYFELVGITIIVVLFPDKFNIYEYYKDLPQPPKELTELLK